ncbi:MAG TPA: DEAD/DEAH box helicase [Thermoanaerobaculia bacterium]|nr:DEAD/DEAH box helicase [Thermoanaerobaculia bacterium]
MTENPFAALGLRETLVQTLTTLGYEAPTPIQERTIPALLSGRDLIGQAQTGTGKTAAFALPILETIDPASRATQALVLTPTRELAMQVAEALHSYAHGMKDVVVLPVYGGAPIVHQLKRLERGVQIVVGTPGRLIDHLDRKSLVLDSIRMIVLDEADEMLKMGFIDDVERILGAAPESRQIALFSATMPAEVLRIAKRHMPDAERIEIEHKTRTVTAIEQRFLNVSEGQKLEVLTQILEIETRDAVLVFRRTKTGAAELAERLEGRGFAAVAMHGDMKQSERENVIRRLRSGQLEIVVATDVAARGLDVEQITHVINYDIPYDVEAYVHRIGRTGRAGRSGVATLFITPRERRMMREIEQYTGSAIKPMKMPTRADVAAQRVAKLKETIRKNIPEGDLDMYLELVEQLVDEGPHDIAEIAAAAARLSSGSRPLAVPVPEPEPVTARPVSRSAGGPRASSDEPKVRLTMSVGKRDGIRPADVVGSIANEADIPGRDIGPIDIRETTTFVTIPASRVDVVLAKVGRSRFRGRAVNLRIAKSYEGAEPRDRQPYGARETRPARTQPHRDRNESRDARKFAPKGKRKPR